jgi:hypothetical protein
MKKADTCRPFDVERFSAQHQSSSGENAANKGISELVLSIVLTCLGRRAAPIFGVFQAGSRLEGCSSICSRAMPRSDACQDAFARGSRQRHSALRCVRLR